MTFFAYFLGLSLGGGFATLAAERMFARQGDRAVSPRWAWLASLFVGVPAAGVGFGVHYYDWQRHGYTETSGLAPIALGLGVPLMAGWAARVTAGDAPLVRVAAGLIAGGVTVHPALLAGQYLLPGLLRALLPNAVVCCPL